jgi:transposase
LVDERGLPRRLILTAGQTADLDSVSVLLSGLPAGVDVIADRGYDAKWVLELAESKGSQAHIPTHRSRKLQRSVDPQLYRQRNLVERFFSKLKHFRRIATRYEKSARNYLAAVLLAASRLWTRFESTT